MTLLWAVFVLMALVGVALVVVPLLRGQPQSELPSSVLNSLVYRDRLTELEQDLEQDRISQEQFEQLHKELELTLLNDIADSDQDQKSVPTARWLIILMVITVPLAASILYWAEGYSPSLSQFQAQQEKLRQILPRVLAGNVELLEQNQVQLDEFIRGLQRFLQTDSDNAEAWYLLGVAYLQVQMPERSQLAFERALHFDPNNTDYLLGMAQVSISMNNGELAPDIARFLEQMIRRDPNNPKSYMTLGMAFYQSGNMRAAIDVWRSYLQVEKPDPQALDLLQRSIAAAEKSLTAAPQAASKVKPGTSKEVRVAVNVADDIKRQLNKGDTLFVYAKAVSGTPMPLAVVRQPINTWPVAVTLSDAQAMTPQMTLSKFEQVTIHARISRTGNAIPQTGDWVAQAQTVALKEIPPQVEMIIQKQIP